MLFEPPGHAKSTYASMLFPADYLGHWPQRHLIACSHTASLAASFGRIVRNFFALEEWPFPESVLSEDSQAADEWKTTRDGGYLAAGVGGAIAGRRADGAIIDDPIKNRKEADSALKREVVWQWYKSDLRTRLKPNAFIILIQTRWHIDDLAGRLLPKDYDGRTGWVTSTEGERWYVVNLPALAEDPPRDEKGRPRWRDPLGRKPGEALWPQWFTRDRLLAEQQAQTGRNWAALYQQRPVRDEGAIIKAEWWNLWDSKEVPKCDITLMSVDTAYTEKTTGDYSAVTIWGRFYDDKWKPHIILRYAWREQLEFPDLVDKLQAMILKYKPTRVLIENKAAGLSVMQELRRRVTYPVTKWDPKRFGDKTARAYAVQSIFEGGAVWVPNMKWAEMVIEECAQFPNGTHDDLVDTVTMALLHLRGAGIAVRKDEVDHGLMERLTPRPPPRPLYPIA